MHYEELDSDESEIFVSWFVYLLIYLFVCLFLGSFILCWGILTLRNTECTMKNLTQMKCLLIYLFIYLFVCVFVCI